MGQHDWDQTRKSSAIGVGDSWSRANLAEDDRVKWVSEWIDYLLPILDFPTRGNLTCSMLNVITASVAAPSSPRHYRFSATWQSDGNEATHSRLQSRFTSLGMCSMAVHAVRIGPPWTCLSSLSQLQQRSSRTHEHQARSVVSVNHVPHSCSYCYFSDIQRCFSDYYNTSSF